jgi:hypothetical protein
MKPRTQGYFCVDTVSWKPESTEGALLWPRLFSFSRMVNGDVRRDAPLRDCPEEEKERDVCGRLLSMQRGGQLK